MLGKNEKKSIKNIPYTNSGRCIDNNCRINTEKENKIKRVIPDKEVKEGEIITVKIDVSVKDSKTGYSLEEYIPEGGEVMDDGGGATSNPNRLAWITIENSKNTQYKYTLRALKDKDSYNPSGIYMFEGSLNSQEF